MLVRARAPLRIGLAGGGTDVSPYCDEFGGQVLNATIDKYAYAVIEPLDDGRLVFVASERGEFWEGTAGAEVNGECNLRLHRTVYNRIVRQFCNGRPPSVRLTTFSDAPAGSGLGSSSTLVVAMVAAFREMLALPLGEYELAQLAFEIERIDAGLAGGRQDHYAAAFGGVNFMEFFAEDRVIINPLRVKRWILSELEASSLLYFTGVSRESAHIIEEQREHARLHDKAALEAMHAVRREAVVMKEAVLRGNFDMLTRSLQEGWEAKKRTAARVSNAEIERVFEAALLAGAKAGKVSGAGGGGFIFLLVDPAKRAALSRVLVEQGGQVMNCHFTELGAQSWRIGV
jgi:D-glycero-alpha-D-manno-heptose-7-phosphate kinase